MPFGQPQLSVISQLLKPSLFFCQDLSSPDTSFWKSAISSASMASPHYRPDTNLAFVQEGNKFKIRPSALNIIWGNDERYWRKPAKPEDPAELLQVSWLEVSGTLDLNKLKPGKEYRVSFEVSLKPDAFGWANSPVYLMAKTGTQPRNWKKTDLSKEASGNKLEIPRDSDLKFRVPDKVNGEKLTFGMYEIWKGRWKGGLVIHEVIIEELQQ